MNLDLFSQIDNSETWTETLCEGAVVLRQFATAQAEDLLVTLQAIERQAPFRQMKTPGGYTMSAALTACGDVGWISDRRGYRYSATDPQTDNPWPTMPDTFQRLAQTAAATAGYADFKPDACLINRYIPKAKMSLHQDKDEQDFSAPIVSVSLGIPAVFQLGRLKRSDKTIKTPLQHGDVVVWGGKARLYFHGINPIKEDYHPLTGSHRINLTFRKAL